MNKNWPKKGDEQHKIKRNHWRHTEQEETHLEIKSQGCHVCNSGENL